MLIESMYSVTSNIPVSVIQSHELHGTPCLGNSDPDTTTVGKIATTDLPHVDSETSAFDALQELSSGRDEVAFVERNGVPIGLISQADFTVVLTLRRDTITF